jgi:predicted ATPase
MLDFRAHLRFGAVFPILMAFEDAHWIDPTSHELLDLTVDRIRQLSPAN